jgi:hypothetical protein
LWAGEATSHPREVIEHALAHKLPDAVEAAYQRSDLLERRRILMADWSAFVTTLPSKVIDFDAASLKNSSGPGSVLAGDT